MDNEPLELGNQVFRGPGGREPRGHAGGGGGARRAHPTRRENVTHAESNLPGSVLDNVASFSNDMQRALPRHAPGGLRHGNLSNLPNPSNPYHHRVARTPEPVHRAAHRWQESREGHEHDEHGNYLTPMMVARNAQREGREIHGQWLQHDRVDQFGRHITHDSHPIPLTNQPWSSGPDVGHHADPD